jgi:16S rRNA (guanine966-N2)-methyltransferase
VIRIITGSAKNKRLSAPDIEGYRAVQEIAKGAVFSIIGDKIQGATCLDLYAGSGNMGIEALSRGASWCDFVDENPIAVQTIEQNLFNCGFIDNFSVTRKDCVKYCVNTDTQYDIIFADPFYSDQNHTYLMKQLEKLLKKDGLITFFHDKTFDMNNLILNTDFNIVTTRFFGKSAVSFSKK